MDLTVKEILALNKGSKLLVKLRSGREIEGTLYTKPYVVAEGKPGLGRVRIEILDHENQAKRNPEAFSVGPRWNGVIHEIPGPRILKILSVAPPLTYI